MRKGRLPLRRSARLVIVSRDGQMLLFRYADEHQKPFWATAGGELIGGETYREAAARELAEETGFEAVVGPMLREREAVYAVARSQPARWLEQYFLVEVATEAAPAKDGWTDEERHTIVDWRWWKLGAMQQAPPHAFKPAWLPDLLGMVLTGS